MSLSLQPLAAHLSAAAALRVLLVDDDEFMRNFVVDMLQGLGVRHVKTARDGREGCEAFDREGGRVDVVVCDIQMPGTDGFEFMGLLADREFKGGVVLLSGMDERTLKSAGLMARFHRLKVLGVLSKPASFESLSHALARLAC